ncbi:MAG TPA: hypothetical protein VFK24_03825 [Gammaproteobacteria bacterium]|nr:hypothetical protein [Gammaproteobacteria bacterium]
MVYNLFLFVHIAAVIIWIGGAFALVVLNGRIADEPDPAAAAVLSRQAAFFGRTVFGPAVVTTLAAGIVMIAVSGMGTPLWVIWGVAGLIASSLIGAIPLRRTGQALAALHGKGGTRWLALRRRLTLLSTVNLLLLLSVIWAMVFKPVL